VNNLKLVIDGKKVRLTQLSSLVRSHRLLVDPVGFLHGQIDIDRQSSASGESSISLST
jgi:hypothetical protein